MYILYSFPISQHSRRVSSLLDEAGIFYENRMVDMTAGDYLSPDYLAINPNHQVPTLIDEDLKIHESNAILRYICAKENLTEWYPADHAIRALCDQWLDWNQCRLGIATKNIVLNKVFLGNKGDAAAIKRGEDVLPELFDILSDGLEWRNFLLGDVPSIADLSIASNMTHLAIAGVIPEQANTAVWLKRVCAIEGFQKNLPSL